MNAAEKAVVTHRRIDPASWHNSQVVDEPLVPWVRARRSSTDLVVVGSHSVVSELAEAGLVDEYRLLTFPTAVGSGRRLFTGPVELELVSAEQVGPAVLSVLSVGPAPQPGR
jgi:dihydrofolate reductase